MQARLNERIARSLGPDPDQGAQDGSRPAREASGHEPAGVAAANGFGGDDVDMGEFEFKLFSASVVPAAAAPKVLLERDGADRGEGEIVRKRRPDSYLAANVPDELRRQYALAAVTGDDVLARSRQRCWGLEMPWRVTRIATTRRAGDGQDSASRGADSVASQRKRPGKKMRIAQRNRQRAQLERQAAAAMQQADKEAHIQDKKKKLNRIKKLRRRAKEREKKQATGTRQADGVDGSDAGSASD